MTLDHDHVGLVTIAEAAAAAGVAQGTIRSWIHRYGLPTAKDPHDRRLTLVSEAAVLDCERDRRIEPSGRPRAS